MSTDRDPEIQALLQSATPPEHRLGFWDDLRADLEGDAVTDGRVVALDRHRRHMPWLLAAAAVVVIGAVVGFGALRDRDGDQGVITDPTIDDSDPAPPPDDETPPDDSTTTTMPDDPDDGPLMPDGDPVDRGSGTVVGVSPDGQWLYVSDELGDGEMGCEGTPRRGLHVEPIDGGERRLAAPVGDLDATTVSEIHFDGGGRVATVVQCEGFGARIVAATVAGDGTLTDVTELTLPEAECHDGTVDGITDLDYVAAGELVAATMSFGTGDDVCRHLFALLDRASEPTLLDQQDVYQVEATPDGQLFTATVDGTIALDGAEILLTDGLYDMALSPSGASLAISHAQDDLILHIENGQVAGSSVFAVDAFDVQLIDDRTGAMSVDVGDGLDLVSLYLDGDDALHTLAEGNVTGFALAPDGSRIFVSITDDEGANPRLIEQPLTR